MAVLKNTISPNKYRFAQNEDLKENIKYLQEEKQEIYEKVRDMYDRKDEAREKLSINGQNIINWFKQKFQEVKQSVRLLIKPMTKPEMGKTKVLRDNYGWFTEIC